MIYKISPRYSFTRSNRNINSKLTYRGMLTTPGIGKYSKNIIYKQLVDLVSKKEKDLKH